MSHLFIQLSVDADGGVQPDLELGFMGLHALSETRLAGKDSLTVDGKGYTSLWKNLPAESRRIHGVSFTIRASLLPIGY